MQGSRAFITRKKSRIILDKSFPIFNELNFGDKGSLKLTGVVDGERLEMFPDDIERAIKTIIIKDLVRITEKNIRT